MILEPIGGSTPKFSGTAVLNLIRSEQNEIVSLLCPAQGSPVPAFRFDTYYIIVLEPIGGSAPKLTGEMSLKFKFVKVDLSTSLKCPAQGSPIPTFRLVSNKCFIRSNWWKHPKVFGGKRWIKASKDVQYRNKPFL